VAVLEKHPEKIDKIITSKPSWQQKRFRARGWRISG